MDIKTNVFDLNNCQVCLPEVLCEIHKRWRTQCIADKKFNGPIVLTCDIETALDFEAAARKLESQHERLLPRFWLSHPNLYQFHDPPIDVLVKIGPDRSMAFDCGLTLTNYQGEFCIIEYPQVEPARKE